MSRGPARLTRRLRSAVLLLFAVPTLAGVALLLLALRAGAFQGSVATLVVAVLVGLAVIMGYVGLVAHGLGRSLVRTLHELRHGAELIATVNPDHRLPAGSDDEMSSLARDINRLADQLREARAGLEREVERATGEINEDRATLAAIVDNLDQAVVVVSPQGRVTLANGLAQEWLGGGTGLLGRSLYTFIDRGVLEASFGRLRRDGAPVDRVSLTARGHRTLDARATALRRPDGTWSGYVLTLRERETVGGEEATPLPEWTQFVGAGTRAGRAEGKPEPLHRPELYDFSLLDSAGTGLGVDWRDRSLDDTTFVVFDTETTGLEPDRGDRVVSLAAVKVEGGVLRRSKLFDALVNPGRPIPAASTALHGIDDDRVEGVPPLDVVLPALLRFAEGAVLVGHETWFDLRFIQPEAKRLGLPPMGSGVPVLDTRLLSRLIHGPLTDHGLDAVAERLGVTIPGRHSALGDSLATAEILVRFLVLLRDRGITTLGALVDAVRSLRGT